jgi:anti-anti-sigma factor
VPSFSDVQFAVSKPVSPEALQALRVEVVQALEAGAGTIAIDVDDVGVLDSVLISALISILREARERGASVSLGASRKSILDTLHITALDKVFKVVSSGEPHNAPVPQPVRRTA